MTAKVIPIRKPLYPLCEARGVMSRYIELAGRDPRVIFATLLASFTHAERIQWDRCSLNFPRDDYGMLPEPVEKFLATLPQPTTEVSMATKTAKKKSAKKRPSAKSPSRNGSIEASKNGDAPGQTYIPGTVDEPIVAMDRDLKALAKQRRAITQAKDEESKVLTQIARRMHENKLNHYKGAGFSVDIVPSAENVKVKPAKDK